MWSENIWAKHPKFTGGIIIYPLDLGTPWDPPGRHQLAAGKRDV